MVGPPKSAIAIENLWVRTKRNSCCMHGKYSITELLGCSNIHQQPLAAAMRIRMAARAARTFPSRTDWYRSSPQGRSRFLFVDPCDLVLAAGLDRQSLMAIPESYSYL